MKVTFVALGQEQLAVSLLSSVLKREGHETSVVYDPALFDDGYYLDVPWLARFFDRFDDVDAAFGLSRSGNIEIATAWLEKAIGSGYLFERPAVDQAMADFLTRHGRALYIRKVYMALAATDRGLARAREVYDVARPGYHSVAQGQIDKLLNAASRLVEFPLVDRPTAMSLSRPSAASCRENTRSKPTSLLNAVTTAASAVSANAGSGGDPGGGSRN